MLDCGITSDVTTTITKRSECDSLKHILCFIVKRISTVYAWRSNVDYSNIYSKLRLLTFTSAV